MYNHQPMTIPLPTVAVSELQRSTKRVLENLRPIALVQSHGRTKGVLLSAELGEKILRSGLIDSLLEIPTHVVDEKSLTSDADASVVTQSDDAMIDALIGPVLSALAQ